MDAVLQPYCDLLLEAAEPSREETVIDIGCGCGATTLACAPHVRQILGVDLSSKMLDCARQRALDSGVLNASFVKADAQVADLGQDRDLVISRAGVMFFEAPVDAFRNIGASVRRGGRLAVVAWRGPATNEMVTVPDAIVSKYLTLPGGDPAAPGPLAFSDDARVEAILSAAGWSSIRCTPASRRLIVGASAEEGAAFFIRELERVLSLASAEVVAQIHQDLIAALGRYATPRGVELECAAWLVTARRSAGGSSR
jgi:SAM-dependent methyltransferase